MDLRYFELQDLLSEALIALEAGNSSAAMTAVRKIIAWAEADWLATASELPTQVGPPQNISDDADDDE